jgi:surface protein
MAAFLWRVSGRPQVERDDPDAFVAWFDTTGDGDTAVTLPLRDTVDVTIDWGDGSIPEVVTEAGNVEHIYDASGYYKVTITGTLARYGARCGVAPNVRKLVAVPSFGNVGLTSLEWAFSEAGSLGKVARRLPSGVETIEGAFGDPTALPPDERLACAEPEIPSALAQSEEVSSTASILESTPDWSTLDITQWDTSGMTDMSWLFAYQPEFNQDISGWDMSNVTDMSAMFFQASSFNQPIGNWDTSNVTDMSYMFFGIISPTPSLNLTRMAFDQDLSRWDVSQVLSWLQFSERSNWVNAMPNFMV